MKWLALAFIVAALMVNGQTSKPHGNTHTRDATPKNAEPPDVASQPIIVVNQNAPKRQEIDGRVKLPSYFDALFVPANLPNLLLVLVGIAGILVAVCSLKTIDKQVAEMSRQVQVTMLQLQSMNDQTTQMATQTGILEKSVEAAQKSAIAAEVSSGQQMTAERAWLQLSINDFDFHFEREAHRNPYSWCITNAGNTPARILRGNIWMRVFEGINMYEKERLEAPYGRGVIEMGGAMISPGATEIFRSNFTDDVLEETQNILARRKDLVAVGFVEYLDSFEKKRTSRICRRYDLSSGFILEVTAPAEWHECT